MGGDSEVVIDCGEYMLDFANSLRLGGLGPNHIWRFRPDGHMIISTPEINAKLFRLAMEQIHGS